MRLLTRLTIPVLLGVLLSTATQPAVAANPPEENIPLGSEPSSCSNEASTACEEWVVERLDAARKKLGLSPYKLPAHFVGMAADRQLLILTDLDRVAYSYTPVYGLNTNLSEAAAEGVRKRTDPRPPSAGGPWKGFASDWASTGGALIAYYLWMYDDGYKGPNADCTSPSAAGCWGHRRVILGEEVSLPQPQLMGASAEPGSGSALIISSNGTTTAYYTWTQAQQEGAGSETSEEAAKAPVLSALSPSSGPASGGTQVTITGRELGSVKSVRFGSTAASSFTVVSSTSIVAVAPAGVAGAVDVTVTSSGGTSAVGASDRFTYQPAITKLSPASGPTSGATKVTILGVGFSTASGATSVRFGSMTATKMSCSSSTECTAVAPAHAKGAVAVRVTVNGVITPKVAADKYTYS